MMGTRFLALANLGKNGPGRWIGGTLTVLFFWFVVGSIFGVPFLLLSGISLGANGNPQFGDPFWYYIGGNLTFLGIWLGLWITLRFIHRRPFRSLIDPVLRVNWLRLGQGFAVWLVLVAVLQLFEFVLHPDRAQFTFDPAQWLKFLPLVLILTPLQTSAEELLFRGYWLQGTGRLTRNPWILIVLNGILFALPHMLNPEVTNNPGESVLLFLNYGLTGAGLAFFTLRDNRLELALGAHAANNLFAALAVNYSNSALTTPAFFTNPVIDAPLGLVSLIVILVVAYFAYFRLLPIPALPAETTPSPSPQIEPGM